MFGRKSGRQVVDPGHVVAKAMTGLSAGGCSSDLNRHRSSCWIDVSRWSPYGISGRQSEILHSEATSLSDIRRSRKTKHIRRKKLFNLIGSFELGASVKKDTE